MIDMRRELPSDAGDIEAVTIAAFASAEHSSGTEQSIVRALRDSGQLAVSLVAEVDGRIVGHVAASPVTISSGASAWYGLGPVSVVPAQQGKGVGSMLVDRALAELRTRGAAGCVVLGEPGYYARHGFKADSGLVLPGVPAEYFQAMAFDGTVAVGQVAYHASFEATA
jgi:predicted N-acetyltransferase YhbS